MWTVATTSVDGLRCIGDGHYNTIALCSLRQYSVARPTLQLPFKPSNPSRLSTNSYPTTANHPNPSCGNYPLQPIKIISPKHPTIAYKLFPFQCQAPHRHLQTLSIIWVPMFTARYYSTDLSISRFDSVYSSSISGPRISPKPCPSTSRTTNTLRWKSLQDNWTTSSLPSTHPCTSLSWICVDLERMNHFRRSTILELL